MCVGGGERCEPIVARRVDLASVSLAASARESRSPASGASGGGLWT